MNRPRFDVERLEVFRLSLDTVVAIDGLCADLPDGRAYIRDQLRRAANSIPLNISEGAGEFAPAEKARFYRMAKRSATECVGQLMVCVRLGLVHDLATEAVFDLLHRVISMLVKLVSGLLGARGARVGAPDRLG